MSRSIRRNVCPVCHEQVRIVGLKVYFLHGYKAVCKCGRTGPVDKKRHAWKMAFCEHIWNLRHSKNMARWFDASERERMRRGQKSRPEGKSVVWTDLLKWEDEDE